MRKNAPFLDFPSSGWKRDLRSPNESPEDIRAPLQRENTPNFISDVFMELSTKTLISRGFIGWVGLFMISASFAAAVIFVAILNLPGAGFGLLDALLFGAATAGCFWSGLCMLRTELHMPRDEPLRFNRIRRKVYAYQYKRDWKRPFSRSAWGVKISVYEWEHLHAEACEAYGALGAGGATQTINLSIVKPGTREFTDRFVFSHHILQGEEAWSMTQLYMQQGPEALPEFQALPRNRNTERSLLNVFWRFAPKVQWPDDIDLESRTAPTPGDQQ